MPVVASPWPYGVGVRSRRPLINSKLVLVQDGVVDAAAFPFSAALEQAVYAVRGLVYGIRTSQYNLNR